MTARALVQIALTCAAVAGPVFASAQSLPDARSQKAAVACQTAIARASSTTLLAHLKLLDVCTARLLQCIHARPGDPQCIPKQRDRCIDALSRKTQDVARKFTATVVKKCRGLAVPDLLASDGLGYAAIANDCLAFQIDVCDGASAVGQCLAARHADAAARMFAVEAPRAGELLSATGVAVPDGLPIHSNGCDACSVAGNAGNALTKCAATIAKAARLFASMTASSIETCGNRVFGCMQRRNGDAQCLLKARAACDNLSARITQAEVKLAAGINAACRSVPYALVSSPGGLNLEALETTCGTALTSATDISTFLACLGRQHGCQASALARAAIPRLPQFESERLLGTLGGALPPFCSETATTENPTSVEVPVQAFITSVVNGGVPGVLKRGPVPVSSGRPSRVPRFFGATNRVRPGSITSLTFSLGSDDSAPPDITTQGAGLGIIDRVPFEVVPDDPATLIVTVRRRGLDIVDYFEVPLTAEASELEIDITYANDLPTCVFDLRLAIATRDDVGRYGTIQQVVFPDAIEPTPIPSATGDVPTPSVTATSAPSPTASPTPIGPACTSPAQPIALGVTTQGALSDGGEIDCHALTTSAGALRIALTPTNGDLIPCFELRTARGDVIAADCDPDAVGFDQIVPADDYVISVSSQNGTVGEYEIVADHLDVGDGMPLDCGSTAAESTLPAGDIDRFVFRAAALDVVSVTIAEVATTTGDFVPRWVLFDPIGRRVPLTNGLFGDSCGGQCETGLLPLSGVYTIEAFSGSGAGTGTYNVSLEAIGGSFNGVSNGPPTPTCQQDGGEGTQVLACGSRRTGDLAVFGDTDTFVFTAATNEVVSITIEEVATTSGSFAARWILFDPAGQRVPFASGFFDDSCSGRCETSALPFSGVYTLKAFNGFESGTGSYAVSLEALSATFDGASNGPPTPACQRGAEGTQVLECGTSMAGEIGPRGDADTFTFIAAADDAVGITVIEMAGADPSFVSFWALYGPDGSRIPLTNGFFDDSCSGQCESEPLLQSGVYTVQTFDGGEDATGSYEVTIELPNGCAP